MLLNIYDLEVGFAIVPENGSTRLKAGIVHGKAAGTCLLFFLSASQDPCSLSCFLSAPQFLLAPQLLLAAQLLWHAVGLAETVLGQ